jgi:uncharacterized protein (TIGR02284 family)
MGTINKNTCDILNDLISINNDRIEGYAKACEEAAFNTTDLINTLRTMIAQSKHYIADLGNLVIKYGGTIAQGTTTMGKIYRTWMDIQITFSADDRKHILNACEFGEDAAQKAYRAALQQTELGEEARSLIAMQKNSLKDAYDIIKAYKSRDKAPA